MKSAKEVLIVEDNEITRFLTEHTLLEMNEGNRLHFAQNGQEALSLLRQGLNPDLILLDLNMPRMDGLVFLERYQQLCGQAKPKVIVLSTIIYSQNQYTVASNPNVIGIAEKPITAQKLRLLLQNHE